MPFNFSWKNIGNWKNIGEKLKKLRGRKSGAVTRGKNSTAALLLRRCYLIAGIYLLVIVVVFSLMLLRWGRTPSPELTGFEGGAQQSGEHAPPPAAAGDTGGHNRPAPATVPETVPETRAGTETRPCDRSAAGHIPPDASLPAPAPDPAAGDAGDTGGHGDPPLQPSRSEAHLFPFPESNNGDLPADLQDVAAEDVPMPAAANPLAIWGLYAPFGNYVSAVLPSGAAVHHLSRGVLLRTDGAAPVAALWDGVVKEVSVMDGLFRSSVLIEHSGGYSTYYGNLREVWVKAGSKVSRGENIGVMPYRRSRAESVNPSLPVSGSGGDLRHGGEARAVSGPRSVNINTVWRGYIADLPEAEAGSPPAPLPALQPAGEREAPTLTDSPLLYLEVRLDGTHLDPLNFIGMRH